MHNRLLAYFAAAWLVLSGYLAGLLGAQITPSETTRQQIAELLAEKESRTPAQRKLGSHLIYAARMARGQRLTQSVAQMPLVLNSLRMRGEMVQVDVEGEITESLLDAVKAAGGQIESALPEYHALRAWIPLLACERLAERDDVGSIMPAAIALTASTPPPARLPALPLRRKPPAPRLNLWNPFLLYSPPASHTTIDLGGVIGHGADKVQALGYDGTGVRVAAMSDGVNSLAALQAAGHLPANVTVVPGQAGSGDEGTALLNVIYDMAPGAQLFFATGSVSPTQMAANIHTLVDTYHVNIILDDVQWNTDGVFQDTAVAQAVTYAASQGVLYFSAAANDNNLDSGTSGTWLGDFTDAGPITLSGTAYRVHSFGNDSQGHPILGNTVLPQPNSTKTGNWIILEWADPWNCPTDDYDLFIVNPNDGTVGAGSTNYQACSSFYHPFEILGGAIGYNIYIVKHPSAASVAVQLNTGRGELQYGSNGAVGGHRASKDAVTVAATNVYYTNYAIGGGAMFTGGPNNPVDPLSSDGPRPMFFDPNGNPLNTTAPSLRTLAGGGGIVLNKVDLTAADGVHTAVALYDPFGGTSAAVPHAASIAALIKSANPYLTNAHVVAAMQSTALPISTNFVQTSGVSTATQGAGIAMANLAVASVFPNITLASNPAGQGITIAGAGCNPGLYTTPVTLQMASDAACTIALNTTTIAGGKGAQQVFGAWSDGAAANPRSFTVPMAPATLTATYQQQYLLTLTAAPAAGGSIAASPASSSGYYNSGVPVELTAAPATGYSFVSWSGDAGGNVNPTSVTMSAARSVTATFGNPALSSDAVAMTAESAIAGQALEIPILLTATGPVYPATFQFDLSFDQAKLTFTAARAGASSANAGKSVSAQALANGDIRIQGTGAVQTTIGNGLVAYAKLTLSSGFTSGSTPVTLKNCTSADPQGTVLSTPCTATVVVSGWCDMNGDLVTNVSDVQIIVNEALGVKPPVHDLNRDGVVNIVDVQRVINASLGLGCPY